MKFELEIDGKCSKKKAKEVFFDHFAPEKGGIASEEVDKTSDYIILINSWEFIDKGDKNENV